MKKVIRQAPPIFALLLLTVNSGCLQLDPEPEPIPELRIIQNIAGKETAIKIADIDPGPENEIRLFIEDPASGAQIPANFGSNSSLVRVTRDGDEFLVSGNPGGMGIVTFTNRAGTKKAELRVFVRNWKRTEVYRHTLEPDLLNYPMLTERNGEIYVGATNSDYNSSLNVFKSIYEGKAPPYDPSSFATYKLIVDRGYHYEAPDGLSSRTAGVHGDRVLETPNRTCHDTMPHIFYHPVDPVSKAVLNEPLLGKPVFAFVLHYEFDGDMVGGYDDRQRLELKTMDGTTPPNQEDSRDLMFSRGNGDIFTHRWKFKLPEDFRVSTEYTHIFQLKPEGADNGNPTFTLTARKKSNKAEVLQLIYRGPIREMIGDREISSINQYPREMPLAPFRGEWIRAEQTVTYDNPGAFRIKLVRISDMRILMDYEYLPEQYEKEGHKDPFVMFRPGNTYIRAKIGVYRRIMHMTPFGLPDPEDPVQEFYDEGGEVRVLYADFEMDKWKE